MSLDRDVLYSLGIGWNHEFTEMRMYLDISELDLLDEAEVEEARTKLVEALRRRRVRQFQNSSTDFLLDFFPGAIMPREFTSFLGNMPFESVRILLVFLANQIQFTYLRSTNLVCPFCTGNISSMHFFLCSQTPAAPYKDWTSFSVFHFDKVRFHNSEFPIFPNPTRRGDWKVIYRHCLRDLFFTYG
jgi:hypothetical protein